MRVNRNFLLSALLLAATQGSAQSLDVSAYQSAFDGAMTEQAYDEAVVIAKTALGSALATAKQDGVSTAKLYSDLALAQRLAGDLDAARLNYEIAISVIERGHDRMNIALERPLLGLGQTVLGDGRPDLALDYFERAMHVRQVSDGPHHIAQVNAIEGLGQAYAVLGQVSKSGAMAHRLGMLIERQSPNLAPGAGELWLRQGRMYQVIGELDQERVAYARAIEAGRVAARPYWVEPYVRTGESFLAEYLQAYADASSSDELPDTGLLADAEASLRKAGELADSGDALNWQPRYRAILALGDFFTVTEDYSEARLAYSEAWKLLSSSPSGLSRRAADLESVVPLWHPRIDIESLVVIEPGRVTDELRLPDGRITIRFTVNRRGRLTDIALLEVTPYRHPRIEAQIKQGLSGYVYRPRMSRGFTVDTAGLTVQFGFTIPSERRPEE